MKHFSLQKARFACFTADVVRNNKYVGTKKSETVKIFVKNIDLGLFKSEKVCYIILVCKIDNYGIICLVLKSYLISDIKNTKITKEGELWKR